MRSTSKVLIAAVVCYASVVLAIAAIQRRLTYFPTVAPAEQLVPLARGLGLEPIVLGGRIVAWTTPASSSTRWRLLVFHGNAGFALDRTYFLPLPGAAGEWQVILAEYPGYGARSDEAPSERAFEHSAEALFTFLHSAGDLPVYVVGESIGTGVAAWLAGQYADDIAGLILITPMSSLAEVAAHHYPWLPVGRFLQDRYDSMRALRGYHGPIAFVLAENDEIIPPAIGRKLYDGYGGPKRLWVQKRASHNTVDYAPSWWSRVFAFVTALPSA